MASQKRNLENHAGEMKAKQIKRRRPTFVDEENITNTGYICAMCRKSLWKPHQTECCKRVCEDCLLEKFNSSMVLDKCPIDVHSPDDQHTLDEYKIEDFITDAACDRFLGEQKVYCDNRIKGCEEPIQLKNLERHLLECNYSLMACPNTPCKTTYYKIDHDRHQIICPYLEVKCQFCDTNLQKNMYQTHLNIHCTSRSQLTCSLCNNRYNKRSLLVNHQRTSPGCIQSGGTCFFSYLGCTFNCDKEDSEGLREHMNENIDVHMDMLTLSLGHGSFESVDSIHKDVLNRLRPVQMSFAGMKQHVLLDRVKIVEGGVTEKRVDEMKEEFQQSTRLLEAYKQTEQTQTQRTDRRLQIIENRLLQVRNELLLTVEKILPGIDLESLTLMTNPNPSADGIVYLTEPGQPTNGEFVWVIDNFSVKRRSAESNEETFIYSEPFYSSQHGYKIMLKLYPYGDGTCRSKFVSLYVVIMKGPYDDSLEWPFQRRVVLAAFEPDCNVLADRPRIFSSDSGVAFRRPENEMNPPTGCANFIDISKINDYLYNDSLTVLVTIEPKLTWSQKVSRFR